MKGVFLDEVFVMSSVLVRIEFGKKYLNEKSAPIWQRPNGFISN
jgi:hypothetical protein